MIKQVKGKSLTWKYILIICFTNFYFSVPLSFMKMSERTLKWVMRFYPPLFFQRIWVRRFHSNFRGVDVVVLNSILNRNYNSSIFGGTIFAAADPFYPILFDQIFKKKGFETQVWLKSGTIKYLKPAKSKLKFSIVLTEEIIDKTERILKIEGKVVSTFHLKLYDVNNEICALVDNEIYIRDLNFKYNRLEI